MVLHPIPLNFPIYEENFIFFFISEIMFFYTTVTKKVIFNSGG